MAEPPVIPKNEFTQIPESALNYYNTNSVRKFIYDRPVQRAPFDPNNEFKSLWIERTCCQIEHQLPGVLRMFQVVSTHSTQVSPIEHACEQIENMNSELSKLISSFTPITADSKYESIAPLSMRLQGILEAAVNGGVAKYMDAFLTQAYISANPCLSTLIVRLKSGIAHQVRILEGGLTLHGRLAPPPVRPLHQRLVERFQTMRAHIHQSNVDNRPSILSQPLPPIPSHDSKQSAKMSDLPQIYGHLIDENIYSVPQDQPNPSRPRSAGLDNGQCGQRVQRSRSIPRSHPINNLITLSSSSMSSNTGPPLPPRSSTLERNHSNGSNHNNSLPEKPALPKRVRKCSNDLEYKLIDIDIESIPTPLKRTIDYVTNETNSSLLD